MTEKYILHKQGNLLSGEVREDQVAVFQGAGLYTPEVGADWGQDQPRHLDVPVWTPDLQVRDVRPGQTI